MENARLLENYDNTQASLEKEETRLKELVAQLQHRYITLFRLPVDVRIYFL